MQKKPISTAFKLSVPIFFCYFPLGIIYGALCIKQGYPWYMACLCSTFVYAGAMQFLTLSLLSSSCSLTMLSCALIPLGIRNIFYGLTMLNRYKQIPLFLKIYLAHGLVDATFSSLNLFPSYTEKRDDIKHITTLTALVHLYWILGTLLGTFAHYFLQVPPGLEFSLTAFFMAVAVEQLLKNRDIAPLMVSLAAIGIATLFHPQYFFLTAIGLCLVLSLFMPSFSRRST